MVELNQDNAQDSLSEESGGWSTGTSKTNSPSAATARHWICRGNQAGLWPTEKAPNKTELEEPSCTPRREPSWRPGLAELARLAEEIISGEAREETAPNTTELENPSCTPKGESSWCPGLAKLARLAEELIYGKARKEMAPNKTNESALVTQRHPPRSAQGSPNSPRRLPRSALAPAARPCPGYPIA